MAVSGPPSLADGSHDEVLARLLALNAKRARDEALAGGAPQLGLGFGD